MPAHGRQLWCGASYSSRRAGCSSPVPAPSPDAAVPWSHSSTTTVFSMVSSTVSQASGPGLGSRGHSWRSTAGSSGCALRGRAGGRRRRRWAADTQKTAGLVTSQLQNSQDLPADCAAGRRAPHTPTPPHATPTSCAPLKVLRRDVGRQGAHHLLPARVAPHQARLHRLHRQQVGGGGQAVVHLAGLGVGGELRAGERRGRQETSGISAPAPCCGGSSLKTAGLKSCSSDIHWQTAQMRLRTLAELHCAPRARPPAGQPCSPLSPPPPGRPGQAPRTQRAPGYRSRPAPAPPRWPPAGRPAARRAGEKGVGESQQTARQWPVVMHAALAEGDCGCKRSNCRCPHGVQAEATAGTSQAKIKGQPAW